MKSKLSFILALASVLLFAFTGTVKADTKYPRLYLCESCDWERDCGFVADPRYKCNDKTNDQALRWSKKPCNEVTATEQGVYEVEDDDYKDENGIFIIPSCEVE